MSRRDVLVVTEVEPGRARRASLSAVTFAREAGRLLGGSVSLLVLGHGVSGAARELAGYANGQVLLCDDQRLDPLLVENCVSTVARAGERFGLLVATATSFGRDLMPRVAARLGAAYAGDCRAVLESEGQLLFERPMFAGSALARCRLSTEVGVVTVRQSEARPADPDDTPAPVVPEPFASPGKAASRVEFVRFEPVRADMPDLAEARVVVGGGRALKDRYFDVLEPLARELGAALAATRSACDAGFAPGDFQVGQTGKIIAPELYVAVGLSGAIQHVAGIRGARVIAAVNTAHDAPILDVSDYALVADLFEAVPELVRCLSARRLRKPSEK